MATEFLKYHTRAAEEQLFSLGLCYILLLVTVFFSAVPYSKGVLRTTGVASK